MHFNQSKLPIFLSVLIFGQLLLPFASARPMRTTGKRFQHVATSSLNSPAESDVIRQITLATNDVAYSPTTHMLYTSVPSSAGAQGNSIATIDPATTAITNSVFVGSEPGKLSVSDNGQDMYVGLNGAAAVR